jgi:hypothetical protein
MQRLAQAIGVLGAQIDRIGASIDAESDGARGLAAVDVIEQPSLNFSSHGACVNVDAVVPSMSPLYRRAAKQPQWVDAPAEVRNWKAE